MTTALLVIDLQQDLVEEGYRIETVLATVTALLQRARQADVPVIYLRHEEGEGRGPLVPGTAAWQIHAAVAPQEGEIVLDKRASDSFYNTRLDDVLRQRGVTRVVVTGMVTEQCVDTTVRSAQSHGYDVTLVADGHTTVEYPGSGLTAAQRIAYHNFLLPSIPNPNHRITVVPGAEVSFAPGK